jgi:glycosyltransferase involved in cell wall biosynthesis
MRLAVYCDYSYRLDGGRLSAELPFARFVEGLAPHCEQLTVFGRLDSSPGSYPFPIEGVRFVPLPHYASGAQLANVLRTVPASAHRFWRALDEADVVWILGPNPPQVLVFALLAIIRRRRVVLGVRQHLPELIRHRHPDRRMVQFAALVLEGAFRTLARFVPVVVVGPDLARRYGKAAELHIAYVSMLSERDLMDARDDLRDYDAAELRVLSVGRLDPEKNPLLLADVLADLRRRDPRWRLEICGDGTLANALTRRLSELGVAEHASLRGYVPIDGGLWDSYRNSHALLHVSLTEGVPQVLLEAFAARLPVVATDVGGVEEIVRGHGWVVPPGNADAAARALQELASNDAARGERVDRAAAAASAHTMEAECQRLAGFLSDPAGGGDLLQAGRVPKARGGPRLAGRGPPSRL